MVRVDFRSPPREGSYRCTPRSPPPGPAARAPAAISGSSPADWAQVHVQLRELWSPEQIAGRLRDDRRLRISHETIYRHIWADKRAGGSLHTYLRGHPKQCRKRYGHYDSRGRLAGKRPITERPAIVDARGRVGDWEADPSSAPRAVGPAS